MPIYEYQCRKCEEHFEVVQKFSDKPLKKCTSCGGTLEKLISQSSFHLKGSGWYVTDYARKGSAPKEDGEKKKPPTDSAKKSEPQEKSKKKAPAADK